MPEGNLHEYAVQAESNLEKLATGLAEAGADKGTIDAVSQMADVTRKIVSVLGKGQENTGDEQPAEAAPAEAAPAEAGPRSFDDASRQMMDEARAQPPR